MTPDENPALEVTTTRDVAERWLRAAIVDGRFAPGERLNEVLIAGELGISRGPLREAIQTLSSAGLLVQVRHKGAYVPSIEAGELRDLYGARIALERHVAVLLAREERPDVARTLSGMIAETEKAIGSDDAPYPSDLDFHQAMVALADNAVLTQLTGEIQHRILLARARSARDPHRAARALDEHAAIVRAIVAGDPERAGNLMEEHLAHSLENALHQLSAHAPARPADSH
ncbi:GntR family transcriptional regulator [Cellulomonas dongxiuzhuiae]|uniref:GntR family transcriptional regulator n=1 Tax=Cellulomonas dongxiuzhuiae TaxID=2819979 RepID=A0ABX8GGH9_9CELL|nr:GntR family transcriptional regulator [Cellulomonas dongxiuzhuiae]MBO3087129.1 GntR family transcriptional regulator [Cellulomonas dongxiuzhuiae]MBO3093512.1 GntR family transcriptional regulator [Cellulomonas dongxiuzhuiae]QWC14644.1 GntR family transcriptional regulator [Cellulomonas dongxiuzhuiae]